MSMLVKPLVNPAVASSPYTFGPFQIGEPLQDVASVAVEAQLAYTSGGTTIDAYLQTSLDGGASFFDIMHFTFATAAKKRLLNCSGMTPVLAAATPGNQALTADTAVDGLIGSLFQVVVVVVGTYVATLRLDTNRRIRAWKAAG